MINILAAFMLFGAAAQGPALDSDKPIDISADELEVRQQESQAIFSGNVLARQGNISMQSERMVVFYDAGAAKESSGVAGSTSISKIEADGGVFFSAPKESAKGARAVYDVSKEQIRMVGGVTLTREQSVVKGSGLVYDFKSGRSVLSSAAAQGSGGGRVRGLFVPGSQEGAAE